MNILVVTGIFPPDAGGPATYVPTVAKALAGRGHRVTVVTTSEGADERAGDRPYRLLRVSRPRLRPLGRAAVVATVIRAGGRADVVFANGLYPETVLANVALRKPLVFKVVGDWVWERAVNKGWTRESFAEFQRTPHPGRVGALERLRNGCLRRAAVVVTPSRYLAGVVAGWGVPESRVRLIPNAVEPRDASSGAFVGPDTRFRLITIGRLVSWKNVDHTMKVLSLLGSQVGLVVVGDGPEARPLMALARRLEIEDRVCFTGRVPPEHAFRLLRASDVLVLNSTYEGLPHVVIEAMWAGVPVVATNVGGTPELIEHGATGLLVPPADDRALRRAIQRLLADSVRRRTMAARAREIARTRLALEPMVHETEAALAAAAGRRAWSPAAAGPPRHGERRALRHER
jgi:glycosyltransferase involved in cell wall biosynthesis